MAIADNLDWRLRREDGAAGRSGRWRRLPELPDVTDPPPQDYDADQALLDAANTALYLGRPLLLTGEPGSGKTEFANHLAWRLGLERRYRDELHRERVEYALRFDTKSESRARDLFYTIDQVARFQRAQSTEGEVDALLFMEFQAMGRAILYAAKPDKLAERLPRWQAHPGDPRRSVVVIDEIDKAPRDFPNDLLNEIDEMYFRIPELDNVRVGGRDVISRDMRPIVVITSNSEKNLPDPFLRRCIYYHIPFPDTNTRLAEILLSRVTEFSATRGPLADDAVAFFQQLRARAAPKPKTSPAELIDWLLYMLSQGARMDRRLRESRELALAGVGALAKDRDQASVRKELEAFLDKR
jgi:MoxR-like ATPase